MREYESVVEGTAAGVPFVAYAPSASARASAPVVVAWHLLDAPRTHRAFAAALPLRELDAWRIYLGLPLTGPRLPEGGFDELNRRVRADVVLQLHEPIVSGAIAEFAGALHALREQLDLGQGPFAFIGGSLGAAVAQLALLESDLDVRALVLINPVVQHRAVMDALGQYHGMAYDWTEAAAAFSRRLDFVARAGETAAHHQPAVLMVVGQDDLPDAFHGPTEQLRDALRRHYSDPAKVARELVPGMGHALADEPGTEPAPQSAAAHRVEAIVLGWLRQHLTRAQDSGANTAR